MSGRRLGQIVEVIVLGDRLGPGLVDLGHNEHIGRQRGSSGIDLVKPREVRTADRLRFEWQGDAHLDQSAVAVPPPTGITVPVR